MSGIPIDRSIEEGEIVEVRREGDSPVLPHIPQTTSPFPRRRKSPSYGTYVKRSSGDNKRAAEGRTRNLSRLSITAINSMMETDPWGPKSPCSPIPAYQDPYDAHEVLRTVGRGGEGVCLLVQRKIDGELRVCKVSKRSKHDNGSPREARILRDLLPPNDRIVRFHDLTVTTQTTQIYFDFYNGGDLSNVIDNHYFRYTEIPESFIWHAVLQLAEAVAFLHYGYDRHSPRSTHRNWTKIIHRDIKPANIFLRLPRCSIHNPDSFYAYPSLVLGDFGLASLTPTSNRVGTYLWQPPEVPHASLAGDCWAVGAVIHAMALDGCPPIDKMPPHHADNRRNREKWFNSRRSRRVWSIRESYTVELENCMFGALTYDPWYRFNALEILTAAVDHYETTTEPDEMLGYWAFDQA